MVVAVRVSHVRTSTRRSLPSAVSVLVAQWRRSEGGGFDSYLGLRNIFFDTEIDAIQLNKQNVFHKVKFILI